MKLFGGILLVSGTTIGGAMLALPVSTAMAGFWPSVILFVAIWAVMTYTAFLFLETNASMKGRINLVTMARKTLGAPGEVLAWVVYLLLLYSLTAAYISGSGALLVTAIPSLPVWAGPIPFVLIFGTIIYLGMRPVDLVNRFLMAGLGVAYVAILVLVFPKLEGELLVRAFPPYMLVPVAVIVTSFGFHIIIPSLVEYFGRDITKVRRCLIWGSCVPLVVYILWELAVIGAVPLRGLVEILESGQPAPGLTRTLGVAPFLVGIFSFFAILTSYLGVSLSLSDFLRDGLKVETSVVGRLVVVALTFIPPLLFAEAFPKGFILALSYGGIFVAILLGMLPIAMVWSERYWKRLDRPYQVWGGRPLLVFLFVVFIAVIVLEVVDTHIAEELIR